MARLPNLNQPLVQRAARVLFVVAAVFAFVMATLPHPPRIPGEPTDKILHVLAFATLGGLAALGFRSRSIGLLFAALAAFGAAIEIIQAIPSLNRDSELADWFADIVAVAVALAATRWLIAWRSQRRASKVR